jgi:hypothetical protein
MKIIKVESCYRSAKQPYNCIWNLIGCTNPLISHKKNCSCPVVGIRFDCPLSDEPRCKHMNRHIGTCVERTAVSRIRAGEEPEEVLEDLGLNK